VLLAFLFVLPLGSFVGCKSPKTASSDAYRDDGTQTEQPELIKEPTETPTVNPTEQPTEMPTAEPTAEPTESAVDSSNASEETRALAQAAVDKLTDVPFEATIGIQMFYQYPGKKYYAPELDLLEELNDSALAFVEIYESYINYYENTNLALYYFSWKSYSKDHEFEVPEGFYEWREMEVNRRNVEILLSMDTFFDKLTDGQRERLYTALRTIFDFRTEAQAEAFGEGHGSKLSDFDASRWEQHLGWEDEFVCKSEHAHWD